MPEYPKLTSRQQEVLALIQRTMATTGAPPTRAEIAKSMGFRSANAAEEHLQALARKGMIELVSGTSRGIRLRLDHRLAASEAWMEPGVESLRQLQHLSLPLIGRVAAGSPIFAQEHIEQTYAVEGGLFSQKPDYLLRVALACMNRACASTSDWYSGLST